MHDFGTSTMKTGVCPMCGVLAPCRDSCATRGLFTVALLLQCCMPALSHPASSLCRCHLRLLHMLPLVHTRPCLLKPQPWPACCTAVHPRPAPRDAWHALQASRDPAVLCEVVNCLPQLMASLGPILAHREMLPALAGLLQAHLGWVGGHLVQVMADLLPHLPPSGHELLLKVSCAPWQGRKACVWA